MDIERKYHTEIARGQVKRDLEIAEPETILRFTILGVILIFAIFMRAAGYI
jgi:hypothetical protein